MTLEQHDTIDFVAYEPDEGVVVLIMIEAREWGDIGELLPDLQRKLDTYLSYVTAGHLVQDFPEVAGVAVRFELRTRVAPGVRELEFLRIVSEKHLAPAEIGLAWKIIGGSEPATVVNGITRQR